MKINCTAKVKIDWGKFEDDGSWEEEEKKKFLSLPKEAERLCSLCTADKELVWFDRGAHSRLRINAPEKYDAAIKSFIENKIEKESD